MVAIVISLLLLHDLLHKVVSLSQPVLLSVNQNSVNSWMVMAAEPHWWGRLNYIRNTKYLCPSEYDVSCPQWNPPGYLSFSPCLHSWHTMCHMFQEYNIVTQQFYILFNADHISVVPGGQRYSIITDYIPCAVLFVSLTFHFISETLYLVTPFTSFTHLLTLPPWQPSMGSPESWVCFCFLLIDLLCF